MNARTRIALAMFALLAVLAGCEDDLPKATEIVHMRVLGARLEVVGDETRATPEPGETVRVTLPTVFPALERDENGDFVSLQTKQRRIRALIIGCTAPDRYTGGIPICQELIDVATGVIEVPTDVPVFTPDEFACTGAMSYGPVGAVSASCTEGTPVVEFLIPPEYRRSRLLFSGIVCEQGTPTAVPDAEEPFICDGMAKGSEAIRVHGLIPVQQSKGDTNHNPDISGLRLVREISGAWKPVDPSVLTAENEADCKRHAQSLEDPAELPLLYGHIDLDVIYEADKREQFEGEPEPLEISLYATTGEMERRFTLFAPGEPVTKGGLLRATLRYTPPKKGIPAGGQLARFYATVRDQRGGFAISEYAMCLGQLLLPEN